MLRSFLIFLSKAAWAKQIVTGWSFAWHAASRFIAGETLADALRVVEDLNHKGILATMDQLGEHTETPDDARRATAGILEVLDAIQASGVQANVSIKLSQIGMVLDEHLCLENLRTIYRHAKELGNFVRIDMEDSMWVDTTLNLYCQVRDEFGPDTTGIVLQSYLYRTEEDVRRIVEGGGRVRLVKGAYLEPPEVAYPKKSDVDAFYDRDASILMDTSKSLGSPAISHDGRVPPLPAIASHDPLRLEFAKAYAKKIGLPKQALEFQMLYGIRRDLQEQAAAEGYPVRIYVPFGTQWYPYFMRRLAERPANVWFFISNFFRK